MSFDLVIFDCDGTLVDSEYLNNKVFCDMLTEHGFPQYDLKHAYTHFVGKTLTGLIADISAKHNHVFPSDMAAQCIARVNDGMAEHLKPVAGAYEAVDYVGQYFKICVASNGERQNVISSLQIAGFGTSFPIAHIFTKNQVKNPKPAPDLFLLAAHKMGTEPSRTIVVEDSEAGVLAAKAAGMRAIGFTGTSEDKNISAEKLKKAGADEIVNEFIHIKRFLAA